MWTRVLQRQISCAGGLQSARRRWTAPKSGDDFADLYSVLERATHRERVCV